MVRQKSLRHLVILALFTAHGCVRHEHPPEPKSGSLDNLSVRQEISLVGTGTCSARGCHGGFEREEPEKGHKIALDEYLRWLIHDKHASASDVLMKDER